MNNLPFINKLSIALNIAIYLFFIFSGFESVIPYYIYLGLNVFSFLYHFILIMKEKMELSTFIIYQFVLLTLVTLTWYALLLFNVNLQKYHWSVMIIALVLVLMIVDYFFNRYRKNRAEKIEKKVTEKKKN